MPLFQTCEIHQNEAPGGVLIFVTGQQEVMTLCRKLKKTFPYDKDHGERTPIPFSCLIVLYFRITMCSPKLENGHLYGGIIKGPHTQKSTPRVR